MTTIEHPSSKMMRINGKVGSLRGRAGLEGRKEERQDPSGGQESGKGGIGNSSVRLVYGDVEQDRGVTHLSYGRREWSSSRPPQS